MALTTARNSSPFLMGNSPRISQSSLTRRRTIGPWRLFESPWLRGDSLNCDGVCKQSFRSFRFVARPLSSPAYTNSPVVHHCRPTLNFHAKLSSRPASTLLPQTFHSDVIIDSRSWYIPFESIHPTYPDIVCSQFRFGLSS